MKYFSNSPEGNSNNFLDTGYFEQAIKHLRVISNGSTINGRFMDEVDLSIKQQEKIEKVKHKLQEKIDCLKSSQIYTEGGEA